MRLNTTKSMKLARRVKGRYGTWHAVRQASRREDGVYVVEARRDAPERENEEAKPQPITG
jgi:hypothetical protein